MSDRRTRGAAPAGPVQWLFWPALILALVILAVFSVIDAPLQTPAATERHRFRHRRLRTGRDQRRRPRR